VLHRLQATQASDLAIRWNCKAGKCGSCSMEINGRPRLGCMTRMSTFGEDEVLTITPMRTFPVIRDLVTDVSFNYAKARQVPSFTPDPSIKPGEFRMQQEDVNRSQEFRKCIECYLCQNTCHAIRDHEENETAFAGPRFLMRVAELEMHPCDEADRRDIAQDDFAKLKPKQKAIVVVDAFPDHKYSGYIAEISPEANRQKATVQVKVQIENPDQLARPDMNATVRFLADENKSASKGPSGVVVPTSAVVDRGSKKVVFLAFNGKALMREVHVISTRTGGYLVDGLVGGENVITGPPADLKDGEKIQIKGQTT